MAKNEKNKGASYIVLGVCGAAVIVAMAAAGLVWKARNFFELGIALAMGTGAATVIMVMRMLDGTEDDEENTDDSGADC